MSTGSPGTNIILSHSWTHCHLLRPRRTDLNIKTNRKCGQVVKKLLWITRYSIESDLTHAKADRWPGVLVNYAAGKQGWNEQLLLLVLDSFRQWLQHSRNNRCSWSLGFARTKEATTLSTCPGQKQATRVHEWTHVCQGKKKWRINNVSWLTVLSSFDFC